MLFLSSSCQPVLAVKPRLPYPLQRSDKALVKCNFKSVHVSYPESYLAAFTFVRPMVRPIRPYHLYQPISSLNSFALFMSSTPLCLYLLSHMSQLISTELSIWVWRDKELKRRGEREWGDIGQAWYGRPYKAVHGRTIRTRWDRPKLNQTSPLVTQVT